MKYTCGQVVGELENCKVHMWSSSRRIRKLCEGMCVCVCVCVVCELLVL